VNRWADDLLRRGRRRRARRASLDRRDLRSAASAVTREANRPRQIFDYSSRSGFSRPVDQVRGMARAKKERATSPLSVEARISA
jgi:hypothetical protein